MIDYDSHGDYAHRLADEPSPDAMLLFGSRSNPLEAPTVPQFSSSYVLTSPETFSPFSTSMSGFRTHHSCPEFDADGDSPGLGHEMHGLRLNSQFPSPVQGTVRMEDVMLPVESPTRMALSVPAVIPNSSAETKTEFQSVESGLLFQSSPYVLALIGIPPNGAKSRVETQIKLDMQLRHHGSQDLVRGAFDYLKLPSYGVSKDKFRLANLKGMIRPLI